ncbi:RNA polymerase sigma factor [Salinisphaera sp. T31B1]|uniref:RNA polymerase sigma factor n=1 Tax=Salinisphaera sp. T31B1 TaxID=727963 RepID=UPI00334024E0
MIQAHMIEAEIPHLRRYARSLLRGHRESADDLVQDTLERAWSKRWLWRPSGRLRSWLFRILYRLYLDRMPVVTAAHGNLIALDAIREPVCGRARPDSTLHCRDVLDAIDALPDTQRAVLLLVAVEQPSYSEGAAMLGIRVGTYRSRLSRAREMLGERLELRPSPLSAKEGQHG